MKKILSSLLLMVALTSNATTEFVVHHAPGGVSDIVARTVSKYMPLDSHVVVYKPGGKGVPAVNHIKTTDGFILATVSQIYVTNQIEGFYDPYKELEVIATIGDIPNLLVCNSKLNINSVPDLVKAKSLNFPASGHGSSEHLATAVLLNRTTNKHVIIPYGPGGNKTIMDVLGGHADCMFANYPTVKEHLTDSRLTPILSSHNLNLNVSIWDELYGEKFPMRSPIAIVVSTKMKKEVKEKIISDLNYAFKNKKLKADLERVGLIAYPSTNSKDIKSVIKNNDAIRSVIEKNKITLK